MIFLFFLFVKLSIYGNLIAPLGLVAYIAIKLPYNVVLWLTLLMSHVQGFVANIISVRCLRYRRNDCRAYYF
jgi:hypothetical protein